MGVLKFQNIHKDFRGYKLDDLNFQVKPGKINLIVCQEPEARKIIITLISGISSPDKGQLLYDDLPINKGDYKHLSKISIVSNAVYFYENLTGVENLKLVLEHYKKFENGKSYKAMISSIDYFFEMLNISNFKDIPVKKYDFKTKQKLRIIRSLISVPDCLVFDEAFVFFDSTTLQIIMEYLKITGLERKLTVLILTSSFQPLAMHCHEISLLYKGKIVETISKEGLIEKQRSHLIVISKELSKFLLYLEKDLSLFDYEVIDDEEVHIYEGLVNANKITKLCTIRDISISKIQFGYDLIENYFLNQLGDKI